MRRVWFRKRLTFFRPVETRRRQRVFPSRVDRTVVERTRAVLTALALFAGAVVAFGLAVYPFRYGALESVVVGTALVAVLLFETVLDEAAFGG